MANFPFYKKPLLSGPSAKTIRPAVSSVKKFRHFRRSRKRFRLRGLQPSPQCHIQHHHAEAPRKNTVPTLECCSCDISGISSSTTTYSMAPAAKLSRYEEKQSVSDCWVSVKQFSKNDTATACQDWLRSTRLGRGSIKSHVRTVKVLGMGLFAFQERVHLWKGVTH